MTHFIISENISAALKLLKKKELHAFLLSFASTCSQPQPSHVCQVFGLEVTVTLDKVRLLSLFSLFSV